MRLLLGVIDRGIQISVAGYRVEKFVTLVTNKVQELKTISVGASVSFQIKTSFPEAFSG